MNKRVFAAALSLLVLTGCTAANNNATEETTADTTVTTVETTTAITELSEEEETTVSESVAKEEVDCDAVIQDFLDSNYNSANLSKLACYKQNGAALAAYVNDESQISYVVYCSADGNAELLFEGNGPMGAVVECYNSNTFVDYQNLENTFYIINDMAMGVGQPIITWHLTADGTVTELADNFEFETEEPGLYIYEIEADGVAKNVIGLREQIPDTIAIGASQIVPITLDGDTVVKIDNKFVGVASEEDTTTINTVENVHDWENIDYTSEADIAESGRTLQEEVPFADYALSVIGDENIVKYFEDNSEHFAEFMQTGTSYSADVACIYGDFDKDGEQEYLAATNYGTGLANNIAIVDNGEVVYWAADNSEKEPFYKVCVGEYFKADPEKITGGMIEDYIKYTYCDYTATDDNRFIGVRSNAREAINYYYQINYNEAEGYSIKLLRTAGWNTNAGEDEDGNIIGRQFVEENF